MESLVSRDVLSTVDQRVIPAENHSLLASPPGGQHDASPRPNERGRGIRLGLLAGTLGIGCCVAPVVLVLLGISSATAAVALGTHLYRSWGWAFKLAGLLLAMAAMAIQYRRAKTCPADRRPNLRHMGVWLGVTAVITYAGLYVLTTILGKVGT